MRTYIDVDALYSRALRRLDDVGRYLDDLRMLRMSAAPEDGEDLASGAACSCDEDSEGGNGKGNGKGNGNGDGSGDGDGSPEDGD